MLFYSLKVVLLLLSLLGYILYTHKKGIHLAFSPVIGVSCVSLAMFVAGLLNIMPVAVIALFLGGFVLLYQTIQRDGFILPKGCWCVGIFFLVTYFFFAFRMRDTQVYWFDSFTHWAIVVRDMLKTGHLPNFTSYLIDFQSYPTGSSGFLYYICKILDETEGSMLFGQMILSISCICAFFAFTDKSPANTLLSTVVILLGASYMLMICVPVTELCVDTLLSLICIASFAIILYYKDDRPKSWVCTSILMTFLVLVKTSGMLFVLLHGFLLVLIEIHYARKAEQAYPPLRKLLSIAVLTVGIPLFTYYVWSRHVSVSFYNGGMSKHSFTLTYLYSIFKSKTIDEFLLIIANFANRFTYFESEKTAVLSFPVVFISCICVKSFVQKRPVRKDIAIFGWCIFTFICYLVGMLGMYLLAMPYKEAVQLASFGRYILTITSYIIGILLIYLLTELNSAQDNRHFFKVISLVLVCYLVFATPIAIKGIIFGKNHTEDKSFLIYAKEEYDIPDGAYCYITGEPGYNRLFNTAKYELWSGNLTLGNGPSEGEYEEFLEDQEYLIVMEETDAVKRFLEAYGLPLDQRVYNLSELQ